MCGKTIYNDAGNMRRTTYSGSTLIIFRKESVRPNVASSLQLNKPNQNVTNPSPIQMRVESYFDNIDSAYSASKFLFGALL